MKRVLSVLIAVLALLLSVIPAAAADSMTDSDHIYFEVPTEGGVAWRGFNMVYCHMWSKDGGEIYPWQSKAERCEELGNGYWSYDISAIDFDPNAEYALIFSNENGMQTYNLNITSSCKGDIVYCEGETTTNPVDGEKSCAVARWKNNGDKVHPAVELDSNGVTINIDEVDPADAETLWGESEGASYALPEIASTDSDTALEENTEATVNVDAKAEKEDGINLVATTTVIIIISAVIIIAIVILAVILARRNRK